MNRKAIIGDALAAFSLASLWFVREFHLALYVTGRPIENVGLFLAVAAVACLYFLLFRAANLVKNVWLARGLRLILLGTGLAAFGSPSSEAITYFYPEAMLYLHLPLPIIVLVGCVAFAYSRKFSLTGITINLRRVALFAAPFGVILFGENLVTALGSEHPAPPKPVIERPAVKNADSQVKNRVIWIIYDEMGRAPLMNRPDTVKMPAFDRLFSESFFAENAHPPFHSTGYSVTSLLTGWPVKSTAAVSDNDMKVNWAMERPPALFSETENVVKDVKAMGGNVAMQGWFVPYTKLFEKELSYGYPAPEPPPCMTVVGCSWEIFISSFEGIPYFGRLMMGNPSLDMGGTTTQQLERNSYLQARARELVANPNIDLCYLHFSIPHSPFITKTDEPAIRGYYDSLEAVDRSFGELRSTLERAGLWDSTTIIVTADHWWRLRSRADFAHLPEPERAAAVNDLRIPFVVKMPGQTSQVPYAAAFNTVVTRYMVRAIMSGEVNTPAELGAWLDRMTVEHPDLVNFRTHQ